MNDSEYVAAEWRQAQYDQLVQDMRPSTARTGQGGGPVGGGIGNLSGWCVFFGMIGAVLGGILGQGLIGAIAGALFLGGAIWAVGAFGRSSSTGGVSRWAVVKSALKGAAAGAILAVVISLEYPDRMGNLLTNWMLFGAIVAGGYRLMKRARA